MVDWALGEKVAGGEGGSKMADASRVSERV